MTNTPDKTVRIPGRAYDKVRDLIADRSDNATRGTVLAEAVDLLHDRETGGDDQ